MSEFNGFDAHRVLRARILGAQRPRKNWLGGMFPDLAIPPVALVIPETHSPPAGKAEGE